jgi:hypothetical protein
MATEHKTARARFVRAVEKLAESRSEAAILRLEADRAGIHRLRRTGRPDASIDDTLLCAAGIAEAHRPHAASARGGYYEHEIALEGSSDQLVTWAIELIEILARHPMCGSIGWRAVLIRIFPGEALRTFHCDPGYGLAPITPPAVVWVEPYPHDDWQQSQRYPTVTRMWPGL